MRNANEQDVARAKATGNLEENVMYNYFGLKVHGKRVVPPLSTFLKSECGSSMNIAETDEGEIMRVDTTFLSGPKQKGPAQQPKKLRRKPRKGTHPETKIPMSADVKLEVGDMVLLENGERVRVTRVDLFSGNGGHPYMAHYWYDREGKVTFYDRPSIYEGENITNKIIPYQEPVKEEKSPDQEAFEAGMWVAHTALPTSQVPHFTKDTDVEVMFADGTSIVFKYITGNWSNIDLHPSRIIVAYRKAKQ